MISTLGLVAALAALMVLTMRGGNLFVVTPLCGVLIALTSGIALLPPLAIEGQGDFVSLYMAGFTSFIGSWFLMFLLGAIFGRLAEVTGVAQGLAHWLISRFGQRNAAFAVVAASAALTYGGVSVFVVAFSVYPMAVSLFREADLPRRFIPATIIFGSATFTMTSAGSPEIQNWIPIPYLGTTHLAAWKASAIVALFMATTGLLLLRQMLRRAVARGEHFEAQEGDPEAPSGDFPNPAIAALPLLGVLVVAYLLHDHFGTSALILALLVGCLAAAAVGWRRSGQFGFALSAGATGALVAIGNTAAVVGFGSVAKAAPAFASAVEWASQLPGGVAGAALAVTFIAAITGSAAGGQAIALPILAPIYLAQGVDPSQLHRAVAIASGGLDSLPHNGYIVTTIRAICNETHARAYPAVAWLTVLVPILGLALCLLLFRLGIV